MNKKVDLTRLKKLPTVRVGHIFYYNAPTKKGNGSSLGMIEIHPALTLKNQQTSCKPSLKNVVCSQLNLIKFLGFWGSEGSEVIIAVKRKIYCISTLESIVVLGVKTVLETGLALIGLSSFWLLKIRTISQMFSNLLNSVTQKVHVYLTVFSRRFSIRENCLTFTVTSILSVSLFCHKYLVLDFERIQSL